MGRPPKEVEWMTNEQGCWICTSHSKDPLGYPKCNRTYGGKRVQKVSRLMYMMHKGELEDELLVLHSCDNPECVNPDHLRKGTNADNTKDKVERGRLVVQKGEDQHLAKLNADKVRTIRKLFKEGKTVKEIAELFNMGLTAIREINKGRTWKHVE